MKEGSVHGGQPVLKTGPRETVRVRFPDLPLTSRFTADHPVPLPTSPLRPSPTDETCRAYPTRTDKPSRSEPPRTDVPSRTCTHRPYQLAITRRLPTDWTSQCRRTPSHYPTTLRTSTRPRTIPRTGRMPFPTHPASPSPHRLTRPAQARPVPTHQASPSPNRLPCPFQAQPEPTFDTRQPDPL